jgi:hypothetical protein
VNDGADNAFRTGDQCDEQLRRLLAVDHVLVKNLTDLNVDATQ